MTSAQQTHRNAEPRQGVERQSPIETPPQQSHIREFADPNHRIAAVASDYAARPDYTVIVAPDHAERQELTQLIRAELRTQGKLTSEDRTVPILITQELSNRKVAANYAPGDILHYRAADPSHGMQATAQRSGSDRRRFRKNLLTVQTAARLLKTHHLEVADDAEHRL